jgi:hypothetical protein
MSRTACLSFVAAALLFAGPNAGSAWAAESALSDEPLPYPSEEEFPDREGPLVEIGDPLLGTGNIGDGFTLPTGAVWNPALYIYGQARTGVAYFDNSGRDAVGEWANRLDIFANLQLSGTERLFLGVSPLHTDDGAFSTWTFTGPDSGYESELNFNLTSLFFEGDIGEIFPGLDPEDTGQWDIGFAVGRQLISFQAGQLINDNIDSIGIVKNNIAVTGLHNLRVTGLFGWNDIRRNDNISDDDAFLWGIFTEADFPKSTVEFDVIYVLSDEERERDLNESLSGDGFYAGLGATQRLGRFNTTFRGNVSVALENGSPAVDTGGLLFGEVSTYVEGTENIVYMNGFWGIEEFTSAARGGTAGGPLGNVGILFAATGLGTYPAALGNRPANSIGGAVGYQMFFNHFNTNLTFEAGGRTNTFEDDDSGGVALGTRFQHNVSKRALLQIDAHAAYYENIRDFGYAARTELRYQF